MSKNLLETVQQYFAGDTARQASTALGESEGGVSTALHSIVPMVLGGLFAHSQQPGGAANLLGMAQQAHSNGLLGNLSGLLGGLGTTSTATPAADGGLLSRGTDLLRSVLGSGYTPAVEGVSQQAGVSSSSVSSLMSMAVPVVLGLLGRHAATNNLDANGLGNYLGEQKSSIMGALGNLPGGLGNLLGGLGLGGAAAGLGSSLGSNVTAAADRTGAAVHTAAREVETTAASPSRWPWLLLLLLGIAALVYFMRGCNKDATPAATTTTTTADTTRTIAAAPMAAPTGRFDTGTGNYIYDTGTNTTLKLADGTTLTVGENSTEARLFKFLNDKSQTVSEDKTQGWISLDRVYFNTGKSTLTNESLAQLKNLGAILKAFPDATFKLGGYTDNTGAAAQNVLLSADRANAARMAVVSNGIAPGRVTAEGYGQEHPLTSNDTPEGRAQNRRVDVRVTKK
ncbi:OmpA family protein [Hymenobacter psoromatis]|uniref:OmpA family protein n=1 Tax=Hymenobacter psoromatis TaxID=1484116 RepID=UPI001CC11C58|nr:OmpA family protein [Hymenobacter psoromatis]